MKSLPEFFTPFLHAVTPLLHASQYTDSGGTEEHIAGGGIGNEEETAGNGSFAAGLRPIPEGRFLWYPPIFPTPDL